MAEALNNRGWHTDVYHPAFVVANECNAVTHWIRSGTYSFIWMKPASTYMSAANRRKLARIAISWTQLAADCKTFTVVCWRQGSKGGFENSDPFTIGKWRAGHHVCHYDLHAVEIDNVLRPSDRIYMTLATLPITPFLTS